MLQFGMCPRCGSEITNDRILSGTFVCGCGWTRSLRSDNVDHQNVDRTCASIVIIAGLVIATFLQAVNWDRHFFSIIPLKTKQMFGMASPADLEEIATICFDRKKYECVERAYIGIAQRDPKNLTNLNRLGQLQYKRQRWQQAAETFSLFFTQKGSDLDAAYSFAQTLSRLKRYDDADRYYRLALHLKDNVLQVTVVRSYVQMLIDAQRLRQARDTILAYRKKSATANLFMNKELDDLRMRLGEVRTASAH